MGNTGNSQDKNQLKDKLTVGGCKRQLSLDDSTNSSSSKTGVGYTLRSRKVTDSEILGMFKSENYLKEKKFGKTLEGIRQFNPNVLSV